jgi:cell shape-determining protein MreC
MTSELKSFRTDRMGVMRRRKLFVTLAVLVTAVILFRGPLSGIGGATVQFVARPFWDVGSGVSGTIAGMATYFSSKRSLEEENRRLSETLDLVAAEAATRDRLRIENDELKSALGRAVENELILARVLSGPSRSPYDTLVIDIGTDAGLAEGMRILYDGDFAIGEVTSVYAHSAVVTLYSSPDITLPVTVGTSSTPAEAEGAGGGSMRITVPSGLAVVVGDAVEIPSLSPTYLGIVEAIDEPEGSSLAHLYVAWPFNVYGLKWVYVATPKTR